MHIGNINIFFQKLRKKMKKSNQVTLLNQMVALQTTCLTATKETTSDELGHGT